MEIRYIVTSKFKRFGERGVIMTSQEREIMTMLKEFNLDINSTLYIMLELKDKCYEQNLFMGYLNDIKYNVISSSEILEKLVQIVK